MLDEIEKNYWEKYVSFNRQRKTVGIVFQKKKNITNLKHARTLFNIDPIDSHNIQIHMIHTIIETLQLP